ncbi:hypothetical protein BZG36_02196 [Bifiguratus adelaidae]|uniref:GH18 domain-containing protein n=1 Tax=Bifiguratus adelaidae TaxID=1938954 RepID=A0A261Y3H5_9FUNG|nr:hypothetical protein BZG36_02196 [Bifiguratus adelaidae]
MYGFQDSAANGGLPLQTRLRNYCDGNMDIVNLAFLSTFHDSTGYPVINFANQCDPTVSPNSVFPGTNLNHCPDIGSDITYCQSQGKIVLLSLGGWTSSTSAPDANAFADQLWNLFMEGTSSIRPFDNAIIDGIDWDIEASPGVDIVAVSQRLKSHWAGSSRKYYMSAAPFCSGLKTQPYNAALLGNVSMDFIWPQFYSDWCSNAYWQNAPSPTGYYMNFNDWTTWAQGGGNPNPNVKLMVGALGGVDAGNPNDFLSEPNFAAEISSMQTNYPSHFGGAMFWDASWCYDASPNYAGNAKSAMAAKATCSSSGGGKTTTTTTTTTSSKSTTATSSTSTNPTTTTTTTSTPPTTTTSTSATPTSTGLPACNYANNGQSICSAPNSSAAYNQCVNGSWLTRACGPGTVCLQTTSSTIQCGYAS